MSIRTLRLVALLLALGPAAAAQEPAQKQTTQSQQPAKNEPEGAAVDDVVVVTASRREEELLNAPATMSVIGAETIATNAPGQSITDLLRMLPGVNTVQLSARDVNITSRGATGTLSDSTLALLDGRSLYQDFFGSIIWDFLPIDASEIKQIEVIRGPASAVWGANAMTGVVNVIAKTDRKSVV